MESENRMILAGRPSLLGKQGYAYSTLDETEKQAYDGLCETIATRGKIRLADYPDLQPADISRLLACIDMDHPEFFWMDGYQNKWAISRAVSDLISEEDLTDDVWNAFMEGADYDGNGTISFMERRIAASRTVMEANPIMAWSIDRELTLSLFWIPLRIRLIQSQLDAYVEDCAATIPEGADDYQVLRRTFEFVARHTTYDLGAVNSSQDVRSVFVKRRSVCKGYAEAFQYLLLSFGIPCFTVQGLAGFDAKHEAGHAWNFVFIDGAWNRVDVTLGDWDLEVNPSRMPQIPEQFRALFVDYSRMCAPARFYKPACFIAYPPTGSTSDYFKREHYEIGVNGWLDYARVYLRLYTGAEPYVLVRHLGDPTEARQTMEKSAFLSARLMCAVGNDESMLDDGLEACIEKVNKVGPKELEAAGYHVFKLGIVPLSSEGSVSFVYMNFDELAF